MEQIILNGITVNELLRRLSELLLIKNDKEELQPIADQPEYLTRKEVARFLKISLPTLHEWSKQGLLQSYRIGNRILYKSVEIQNSVQKVMNGKYKKTSINHI